METITIKLNDYQVSLLRAKIKDLSVQSYMENLLNECPHVPKLAKFKQSVCPKGMIWNVLCSDKI